jgi:hypothetical protein
LIAEQYVVDKVELGYNSIVEEIVSLNWVSLSEAELSILARAYYYFSVQFRENLLIACQLYPDDLQLAKLLREECDTENLSPWPGVAAENEKLDHDEFMRRVLELSVVDSTVQCMVDAAGRRYLSKTRSINRSVRAMSIATYEDGGLERVFRAILLARNWETPLLRGFRHFLIRHIGFDNSPEGGHGSLVRHIAPDKRVRSLWVEFRALLFASLPQLAARPCLQPACPHF